MSVPSRVVSEEWRAIPGFDGYEVSNLGRVVSRRRSKAVILKPWATPKGYHFVRLWSNGLDSKPQAVHRLVMRVFVGPRPDGQEIRHLDSNPDNNRLDNLAYGTHTENVHDSIKRGTHYAVAVRGQRTHCRRGHPYDLANTRRDGDGARRCRTCQRQHKATELAHRKERRRAAAQ